MITRNEVTGTLRTIGKICKHHAHDTCNACPIFNLCRFLSDEPLCEIPEDLLTESAKIIENWAALHIKTYQQDFLKKFPNAKLNEHGFLDFCREHIYGTPTNCKELNCSQCWAEEMEEETEEES
ncbi:MAG: hypothetical protein J6S14_15430 [Clostridia bacterium]|nr:hypothetical protein [Clostridia bacterium]